MISEKQMPVLPWIDNRLTKEAMDYLWDDINGKQTDYRKHLAGNISKSGLIEDKDNWFYENVLKRCTETIYFKDWNNYYNVHIAKLHEAPEYVLDKLWVNYQKQNEFNPPHDHSGVFSFVVFMKIPTHWKEQHALPISVNSNSPSASNFEFLLGQGMGPVENIEFTLCPGDEGKILFFPAWLYHQVFPFYECEEDRITISGNIIPKTMVEYFDVRKRR
jgi:hypothetical protein